MGCAPCTGDAHPVELCEDGQRGETEVACASFCWTPRTAKFLAPEVVIGVADLEHRFAPQIDAFPVSSFKGDPFSTPRGSPVSSTADAPLPSPRGSHVSSSEDAPLPSPRGDSNLDCRVASQIATLPVSFTNGAPAPSSRSAPFASPRDNPVSSLEDAPLPSPRGDRGNEDHKSAILARYECVVSEILLGRLFVGSTKQCPDHDLLVSLNIGHVVIFDPLPPHAQLWGTGRELTIIPIVDSPHENITAFFYQVLDIVTSGREDTGNRGKAVLLLCGKGVSRSCAFAIACLMHLETLPFKSALQRVAAARPCCEPNIGFQCQLIEWERRRNIWRASNSVPGQAAVWRIAVHTVNAVLAPESRQCLVPKLCIIPESRQVMAPCRAVLDSRTAFVLVPEMRVLPLVLWEGSEAPRAAVQRARLLVQQLRTYEGLGEEWPEEEMKEGEESQWFLEKLKEWDASSKSAIVFDDISDVLRVSAFKNES